MLYAPRGLCCILLSFETRFIITWGWSVSEAARMSYCIPSTRVGNVIRLLLNDNAGPIICRERLCGNALNMLAAFFFNPLFTWTSIFLWSVYCPVEVCYCWQKEHTSRSESGLRYVCAVKTMYQGHVRCMTRVNRWSIYYCCRFLSKLRGRGKFAWWVGWTLFKFLSQSFAPHIFFWCSLIVWFQISYRFSKLGTNLT